MFEALGQRCDGHSGLPHAVLTSGSVGHVSFLPKQLVDIVVKSLVKPRIPSCAREIREQLARLQGVELAYPAEDDELVEEPVDDAVELQEEEQPEQDLHDAEVMLRRVHANLGHPSNVPRGFVTSATRRTGAVRPLQVFRCKELGHTISIDACHWKSNRDGREAIIVNIIDEASRFHVALVLKEGGELGNFTAMDYFEALCMNWFRFARAPFIIRVDSGRAFKSHEFRE